MWFWVWIAVTQMSVSSKYLKCETENLGVVGFELGFLYIIFISNLDRNMHTEKKQNKYSIFVDLLYIFEKEWEEVRNFYPLSINHLNKSYFVLIKFLYKMRYVHKK